MKSRAHHGESITRRRPSICVRNAIIVRSRGTGGCAGCNVEFQFHATSATLFRVSAIESPNETRRMMSRLIGILFLFYGVVAAAEDPALDNPCTFVFGPVGRYL